MALSLEDVFTPENIEDPYPLYSALRESGDGVLDIPEANLTVLTRYADCQEALRSKALGHTDNAAQSPEVAEEIRTNPAMAMLSRTMLLANPPDHTRLRGLVVKAFDARRIAAMRERIRAIANELVDGFVDDGQGDLVRLFNHPLPVIVICDLLGIPKSDQVEFTQGTRISGRLIDPTPMTPEELAQANENTTEALAYYESLCDARRANPEDDLLTALVQSETEHGKLSREELTANISLLFGAGHETTVNLLGNALLALHRNPDQLALLQQNNDLLETAVDEFLRYDSSVQLSGRGVLEPTEIAGHELPEGREVLTLLAAANRDPREFADPDVLDVTRSGSKPLSFGGGIHYCLGAALARMEVTEAFKVLFERLPDLKLDNVDAPTWKQTITLRGVTHLPATWSH